jgi:antitoxin CptB
MAADTARIRWRCRRGVKELDVLMERFAARCLPRLSPPQAEILARLLEEADPDILDWILERRAPADPAYGPLLTQLRGLLHDGDAGEARPCRR